MTRIELAPGRARYRVRRPAWRRIGAEAAYVAGSSIGGAGAITAALCAAGVL